MPRSSRLVDDGGVYHILNRGNGQQKVFQKDGDYLSFLDLLGQMLEKFDMALFAYCLMPNHFHLLIKVQKGENLSRGMQWFMTTQVTITGIIAAVATFGRALQEFWYSRRRSFSDCCALY